MESKDQRNAHSSGHESQGVHLCHKCGWPFPNAHPSARHRRAHRRICGTIEGYKLVGSEGTTHATVSDDEHHSDEEHKGPGLNIEHGYNIAKSIGGTGAMSNRSEDEAFCDAVSEFPDSGLSLQIKEELEGNREPASKDERTVQNSLDVSPSYNDVGNIQPLGNSTENSQITNPEVSEISTDPSGSIPEAQGLVSSLGEECAIMLGDDKNSSACDSYPFKAETPTDSSEQNKKIESGDDCSMKYVQLEGDIKGHEDIGPDKGTTVIVPSELVAKSEKIEELTSDIVMADGITQAREEHGDIVSSTVPVNDQSPEVESVEHVKMSGEIAQINMDTAPGTDSANYIISVETSNGKEGTENVHVLSVPDNVPVVHHAEVMLEDFKDHKGVKLHQYASSDSCEINTDREGETETPCERHFTSVQSGQLSEGTEVHASDMHVLEDNHTHEVGNDMPVVNEVPVKGEADIRQIKVTSSEGSEVLLPPTDVGAIEKGKGQAIYLPGEQQPYDVCDNSLQMGFSETGMKDLSDADLLVASLGMEVNHRINSSCPDDSRSHQEMGAKKHDIAGNDDEKRFKEGSIAESNITTFESSGSLSDSQVSLVSNMLKGDDASDCVAATEKHGVDGIENGEGLEYKILSVEMKTIAESANCCPESKVDAIDVRDVKDMKLQETECKELDRVSDVPENVKEHETNINEKEVGQCASVVSMAAESCHDRDDELVQKNSVEHVMKEPVVSPLDAEPSIAISVAANVNHSGEFRGDASGIHSQSMQGGHGNSFVKDQHGPSPIEISIDSSSQTDSLEGNWGSVSVLSTQSDTLAAIDAEAGKANLKKPKGLPEEKHSEESDVFEPPSFMTLVEHRGAGDHKVVASEIQTVQNPQQAEAAALRAGWFPSLTHVVNESPGRKKNEEIIAKVTNWSTATGKPHTPLKNLLGEAIEPRPKTQSPKENTTPSIQKDESAKDSSSLPPKLSTVLGHEASIAAPAKGEVSKEWNSPARYPADIKREKRKVKGRPYWVQFVCCSSVN